MLRSSKEPGVRDRLRCGINSGAALIDYYLDTTERSIVHWACHAASQRVHGVPLAWGTTRTPVLLDADLVRVAPQASRRDASIARVAIRRRLAEKGDVPEPLGTDRAALCILLAFTREAALRVGSAKRGLVDAHGGLDGRKPAGAGRLRRYRLRDGRRRDRRRDGAESIFLGETGAGRCDGGSLGVQSVDAAERRRLPLSSLDGFPRIRHGDNPVHTGAGLATCSSMIDGLKEAGQWCTHAVGVVVVKVVRGVG